MDMKPQDQGVPSIFVISFVQVALGLFLFIALFHGERPLAIWALLLLGLAAGTRQWARVSLSGMRCHFSVDKERVFPDEKLTFKIRAENPKFLPVWLQVNVPVSGLLPPSITGRTLTKETRLLWYQRAYFEWELIAQRRGVHQMGPAQLLAGDLFAFFSKAKRTEESYSIIVYPRLVSLKPFSLARRDFFGVPGAKSPVQDPIYVLGTHDYQQCQPAKHIHWKASARHHRLQQKIFEPSEQEKILLVVDVDRFAEHKAEEEFERTLEIVASLAVKLGRRGNAVGLVTNGTVVGDGPAAVPVARSSSQLPALLEVLARLRMELKGNAVDTLRQGVEGSWGISCVLFSYEEGKTVAALREYFRDRRIPVTFLVWRPGLTSAGDRFTARQGVQGLNDLRMGEAAER